MRHAQDRVAVAGGARTGGVGGVDKGDRAAACVAFSDADHLVEARQRHLHLLVIRPEAFGDADRLAFGQRRIVIGHDEAVATAARARR